jgi:holliday junction DNA helicase RuvA
MYDYIKGTLVEKTPTQASVEAAGVGYAIIIPTSTYELLPDVGAETKVFTHLSIREDAHKLYGFFTKSEREVFRRLIDVNMIGPKVAINVLSNISVGNLVAAINTGDASRLKSLPSIKPKTAQRLALELKGKLDNVTLPPAVAGASSQSGVRGALTSNREVKKEVYGAMVALGYTDKLVIRALERVETVVEPGATLEEWIRAALKVI